MLICNGKKIIETGDMRNLKGTEHEEMLDVHGAYVLPRLIDAHSHIGISEEKKGTVGDDCNEVTRPVTPSLRAIVGPDLTSQNKIEVQNMSFKTCGVLHRAGVLTAITTDHPVSLLQYLPICVGLAVRAGLPLNEGYRCITINAAKICGVEDRIGSIEAGKDADIAIFDENPVQTLTNTLYTIIDGDIVYQR